MFLHLHNRLKSINIFCLIFWLFLLFITLVDLFFLDAAASFINTASTVLLVCIAACIVLSPRLWGWIFLVLDALLIAIPSISVGILVYVCVAVFFLWGWYRYTIDAVVGILILLAGFSFGVSFQIPATAMLLILLITAFTLGYVMYRFAQERDTAVAHLWKAKIQQLEEFQRIKTNLAIQLHDSLAATLSVITKLAESVRQEAPANTALSVKAGFLEEQARACLKELRETIQLLDDASQPANHEVSLIGALARTESIASSAGIDLTLEYEETELQEIPVEIQYTLFAFLREASTNLLKYATPSTNAVLSISHSTHTIEIMMKNQYRDIVHDSVTSSGKGLKNLQEKFEFAGGELDVWAINNWWHVHGEIPLEKEEISDPHQP